MTTAWPLPDSPTKVAASTHFTRAFMDIPRRRKV